MPNEAVIIELLGNQGEVIDFSVDDQVAIEKGTLLMLQDARKVSGAYSTGPIFAGISASEKVASDGQTNLGCYTFGIFDLKVNAGAGVTLGAKVALSGANLIRDATEAEIAAGKAVGKALETGSANEVIEVLVTPNP